MYGKSLQRNLLSKSFTGSQIIENPELLCAIEEVSSNLVKEVEIDKTEEPPIIVNPTIQEELNTSVLVPANKQIETRLPSGKRRITPMFLKPAPSTAVPIK